MYLSLLLISINLSCLGKCLKKAWPKGDPESTAAKLSDATRKMAILKSNETMMVRRYKAIEDSEVALRQECAKLKADAVEMEKAVMEKVGVLQRYKDMASFKMEALQKSLAESVPASALEMANRQLSEVLAQFGENLCIAFFLHLF